MVAIESGGSISAGAKGLRSPHAPIRRSRSIIHSSQSNAMEMVGGGVGGGPPAADLVIVGRAGSALNLVSAHRCGGVFLCGSISRAKIFVSGWGHSLTGTEIVF